MKYQRLTPSGCKDIWIRKHEFVTKTQTQFQILFAVYNNNEIKKNYSKWWYYIDLQCYNVFDGQKFSIIEKEI